MLVITDSLTKRYGRVTALDQCTIQVRPGEVFGLLGPNGAGKTTLLRLLLGYQRPTHGSATIDGLDCYRHSVQVRRRVAYLPGEVRLFRHLRGSRMLDFFSQIRPGANLELFRDFARRLDLDLSRQVAAMSTGMRQKLALAATLATGTPLLILDEPTSHLDPSVRNDIATMIGEVKQSGRTVIFSSHILSEVEDVCDRVAILRSGRMVHTQIMSDLRRQHRIQARLTGPLPCVPESLKEKISLILHENGHLTIETPGDLAPLLGWLATLPVAEMNIQPVGLRAVYHRNHADTTGSGESPQIQLTET